MKRKLTRMLLAAVLLAGLALSSPLAAQAADYPDIRYAVTHVTQTKSGCYAASVAMCGLWNGTLSGTPEDAYRAVLQSNGNSVYVSFATLDLIGYKQTTDELTLSNLYEYLKRGPVIVGERCGGSTHYSVVFGYEGSGASLTDAGFLVMDTTLTAWRLSDSSKLTEDGTTTLDRWIGGAHYINFTYCVSAPTEAPEQAAPAAAETPVRFARTEVWRADRFSDVSADQWFAGSVAAAFELGLMKGSSETAFDPYGDVTLAEAVTMAARIHSIYTTGSEDFTQSGAWYQVYLDYAYRNGIIGDVFYRGEVTQKATRAQFAEILANSLPAEALPEINRVEDGAIPDVQMRDAFASSVYRLYRAGILTGSDGSGSFCPHASVTRAEAAAIVSRMAESDSRVRVAPE